MQADINNSISEALVPGIATITTFDEGENPDGITIRVDDGEDNALSKDRTQFSPTSFLVESLIDQLCKLIEKDPVSQKRLYHAICSKLHQMNLIDETYSMKDFEFIRSRYQKAFLYLLHITRTASTTNETGSDKGLIELSRSSLSIAAKLLQYGQLFEWSRYLKDYEELEYIARGGFGKVYKVRNKLDGGQYAIKKIRLRCHNIDHFRKSLQEVKLLAQLNHPNIVTYKAAWIEPFGHFLTGEFDKNVNTFDISSSSSETDRNLAVNTSSEDSSDIVFKNDISGDDSLKESSSLSNDSTKYSKELSKKSRKTHFSERGVNSTENPHSTASNHYSSSLTSDEKAVCKVTRKNATSNKNWAFKMSEMTIKTELAVLYIQMQLCDKTLRAWLDERNEKKIPVDIKQCISVFKHIVCGVEYIHSKGIVHHDIKPCNIFVNNNLTQVQVGDFGLACLLQHSQKDVTLVSQPIDHGDHKNMELGTKLYAAPEQLQGDCNPKSDIYSLGIVLFELLHPFSTYMEKSHLITQLKAGSVPEMLNESAPQLVELLLHLIVCPAEDRPTSKELLISLENISNQDKDEAASTHKIINYLLSEIRQRDKEIYQLKQKLLMYESHD